VRLAERPPRDAHTVSRAALRTPWRRAGTARCCLPPSAAAAGAAQTPSFCRVCSAPSASSRRARPASQLCLLRPPRQKAALTSTPRLLRWAARWQRCRCPCASAAPRSRPSTTPSASHIDACLRCRRFHCTLTGAGAAACATSKLPTRSVPSQPAPRRLPDPSCRRCADYTRCDAARMQDDTILTRTAQRFVR